MVKALIIAGTSSNAGKTVIASAIMQHLKSQGRKVVAAKIGPDYIDPQYHKAVLGIDSFNLDLFAFSKDAICERLLRHTDNAEYVVIEGVMGLNDGAMGHATSTLDVAKALNIPVLLVHNAQHQFQSAALALSGFVQALGEELTAAVLFNKVASSFHAQGAVNAFRELYPDINAYHLISSAELELPHRHLGLVQADEIDDLDQRLSKAAMQISGAMDMAALFSEWHLPDNVCSKNSQQLPPLGQKIAIARDEAFSFLYPHFLDDWQQQGAEIHFFSPIADEAPARDSDAVFLPGGYPELHAGKIAHATHFKSAMRDLANKGVLIYGECGGYMTLGAALTDHNDDTHEMLGLLPASTTISSPKRVLGYRSLVHHSLLPWSKHLKGHEFHFAQDIKQGSSLPPLFEAQNSSGKTLAPMGIALNNVMGSFAHVISQSPH